MEDVKALLREYAARYETAAFLPADPSWFMHQVTGVANQEATAFVASCLSYGSRKQFFPKIQHILDCAGGNVYEWILSGAFERDVPADASRCYYRLYTYATMHSLLAALRGLLTDYGTLGDFIRHSANDGFTAVQAITGYFAAKGSEGIVPKDASSACKRVCMFLRWMVRDGSPVDLGLWSDAIDKRTLIMPLDTHVLQEACRLGLMQSRTATMASARRLTRTMAEVFPDDPLKGDFALFGYGVDSERTAP